MQNQEAENKNNQRIMLKGEQPQKQKIVQTNQKQEYNSLYYLEYRRLHQSQYLLSCQLKQISENKQLLWHKLAKFQKKTQQFKDDIRGQEPEKKKRFRRTAQQISRKYICKVQSCHKCYGSQGSLQQHVKLKHPQLYFSKKSKSVSINSQQHGEKEIFSDKNKDN